MLPFHGETGAGHHAPPVGKGHPCYVAILHHPGVHQLEPWVIGGNLGVDAGGGLHRRNGPGGGDIRRQKGPGGGGGVKVFGFVIHPQAVAPQVVGEELASGCFGLGGAVAAQAAVQQGAVSVVDVGPGAGDHRHISPHGEQGLDAYLGEGDRKSPPALEGGQGIFQGAAQVQLVHHREGHKAGEHQCRPGDGRRGPPEKPLALAASAQLIKLAGSSHSARPPFLASSV